VSMLEYHVLWMPRLPNETSLSNSQKAQLGCLQEGEVGESSPGEQRILGQGV
jgi:hypothetical protein